MKIGAAALAVIAAGAIAGCAGNAVTGKSAGAPAHAPTSPTSATSATSATTSSSALEPNRTGNLVPTNAVPVVQSVLHEPLELYTRYVNQLLDKLRPQLTALQTAAASGNLSAAEHDWLLAHISWLEVGQDDNAYGAFDTLGEEIDGKAYGLPGTTSNANFTGFHKVELDLWKRHDTQAAAHDASVLAALVKQLTPKLVSEDLPDTINSLNAWVLRAHEILEDAVRDSLTQNDDYGSNSDLASLAADVIATREMLQVLAPVLHSVAPRIIPAAASDLEQLSDAISAAGGAFAQRDLAALPLRTRLALDQATSAAVETLAPISELMQETVPGAT